MAKNDNLLEVDGLKTYFNTEIGLVKAVDDVSFNLKKGELLGIVGETGCGKSVTSLSIMQLVPPPGKIKGGHIYYHRPDSGETLDIVSLDPFGKKMRSLRGQEMAIIFQEPMTSLNPVYTIGEQIVEGVQQNLELNKQQARERAIEMLRRVNISAPEKRVDEYPHEFSGGMRQRAVIAMALSCNPNLLIADEPTTALDVTVEAQILELMTDLQDDFGMSIMLITHDLGVIGEMTDRVIVMYMGKIAEIGTTVEIFHDAKHPYTQSLIKSIPHIGNKEELVTIEGSVPSPYDLPKGCYFAPRCKFSKAICVKEPPVKEVSSGHFAKCWLYEEEGDLDDREAV